MATAELSLRDGRVRYVTVMFPNSPGWSAQYTHDQDVVGARLLPEHIERRHGGWFATRGEWSGPWKTEAAALLALDGKYDEAQALEGKEK